MQVSSFRDCTGQDVICEVVSQNDTQIEIKNTLVLVPTPEGMRAMPYSIFTESNLVIQKNSILILPYNVESEEIVNFYKQKFGGIIEPVSKLLL